MSDDAWGDTADPTDEVVVAGPWRFVLRGAEIADVTHRGVTVLRAIRFVTRDHDWRTADDTVLRRTVETDDDVPSANVRIDATSGCDDAPVLEYRLDVALDGGTVHVDAVGTTTTAFRRNRIGLVVLHPPTLAGTRFTTRHPTAPPTEHTFPVWIAPHQPATDVVGYEWTVDGIDVDVSLAGDGFEMEDQRNWTDASFKTYSTPLSEPFPVALDAGTAIHQSVTLACGPSGRPRPGGTASPATDLALLDGAASTPVGTPPTIQLLAASAPAAARPDEHELVHGVPILVEPVLGDPNVAAVLASARHDAGDAPLDVRFVTDDPALLRAAIDDVLESGPVVRVGAFDPSTHVTTPALQRALRAAVATHGDGLGVVAGTRAHFTELNRTIDLHSDWDGPLTFSVTPQMHDRSRAQVTESVRMQRWVVSSASRLAAGRPLHVGPVTLRPRFNAVATSPRRIVTDASVASGYGPQFVPGATDPEQHSAAAAAWFAAAVAALTVPGVASITLAEAWGPRGTPRRKGVGGAFRSVGPISA
jgi:hypothetical protein